MRLFSYQNFFKLSLGLLTITGYGLFVFAAAPTGGYIPGQTNDPACAPGDTDCVVTLSVVTNTTYTWIGVNTGQNNGSTNNTVFIGIGAGDGATNANYSNFIGTGAGLNATNASNSNFFGEDTGCNATNADNSNFFGKGAGCYATNANNSNFFGNSAGVYATNADHSTFFGDDAGGYASSAYSSAFIGASAGYQATNAYQANFLGREAGYGATNASDSSFLGYQAGYQATDANNSFFAGNQAGYMAYGANTSVMLGNQAGYNETGTLDFLTAAGNPFGLSGGVSYIGFQAGYGAESAVQATFIGTQAGYKANTSLGSTIVGFGAGANANYSLPSIPVNAASVIIGANAAIDTQNTSSNILIGNGTGKLLSNTHESTFIGHNGSGENSANVERTSVLGTSAGDDMNTVTATIILGNDAADSSSNINHSVILGPRAGSGQNFQNTLTRIGYTGASGSFIVGEDIQGSLSTFGAKILSDNGSQLGIDYLVNGFIPGETITGADSGVTATVMPIILPGSQNILIGANTDTNGYINSIALGALASNFKDNQMVIGSTTYPINEIYIQQSGTSCTIDNAGLNCSSDETLKTNITALPSVLDTLTQVQTVTYNWVNNPNGNRMIGFLAQDLQQYFPQLVSQGPDGKKSVNYANMTPVLVQAIRELDIKLDSIEARASDLNPTFKQSLISWFTDRTNGITDLFAQKIHVEQVCVGSAGQETCVDKSKLDQLLQSVGGGQQVSTQIVDTPTDNLGDATSTETGGGTETGEGDGSGTTTDEVVSPDSETSTEVVPIEPVLSSEITSSEDSGTSTPIAS